MPTKSKTKVKSKATKGGLNKKQLAHLEKRLHEERARVMKELGYYDESFNSSLQASDGDLSSYSTRCPMPGCASSARRKKKMESAANRRLFWTTAGAVVAADLVTKLLAESLLARHLPVQVVGEYVQLRLVYNQCAAFGLCLGAYSRWIFFGLAIVALFVLRSMVISARPGDRFRLLALALVCAGAVGNVIDRIRSAQGVVDFVDVGIGSTRWPTFNVADSAITVGAIALAISLWLEGRAQERAKEAGAAQH